MKFYIASSLSNREPVQYVRDSLSNKGYFHTYDWTLNGRSTSLDQLREIGQKEKDAVIESDLVIVLLPGGKGTHVELGIALAHGKRIILFSENEEILDPNTTSTFYHLPEVEIFIGSIDELISRIVEE